MSPSDSGVSEAQASRCVYLALSLEGDGGKPRWFGDEALRCLRNSLETMHDWLSVGGSPGGILPAPPDALPHLNEREDARFLYPGGPPEWNPAGGKRPARGDQEGFVCAHASNGVLLLQAVSGQHFRADPSTWKRLRQALWAPDADRRKARYYLGEVVLFGARVRDEATARRAAQEALYSDAKPEDPKPLRFAAVPFGGWLFSRPGKPDEIALFYPDTDDHEALAADYFNDALPFLLLYAHKIAHQYQRGYEGKGGLRERMETAERDLETLLKDQKLPPDLTEQEKRLQDVAAAYSLFAGELGKFKKVQQNTGVNFANLEDALSRNALPADVGPLAVVRAGALNAVRQMEADDKLYQAAAGKTQMSLQAMQVRVDVSRTQAQEETNRLEKESNEKAGRRNVLIGVFGVLLAVGNLVTESMGDAFNRLILGLIWWWRGEATSTPDLYPFTIFAARLTLTLAFSLCLWGLWRLLRFIRGKRRGSSPPGAGG